jgi:hypothetical protein
MTNFWLYISHPFIARVGKQFALCIRGFFGVNLENQGDDFFFICPYLKTCFYDLSLRLSMMFVINMF